MAHDPWPAGWPQADAGPVVRSRARFDHRDHRNGRAAVGPPAPPSRQAGGGTPGGQSSGDIFLAFSVADAGPLPQLGPPLIAKTEFNGELLDPFYLAVVEAIEEAVVNALVAGEDVATVKPAGGVCHGIDTGALAAIFSKNYG